MTPSTTVIPAAPSASSSPHRHQTLLPSKLPPPPTAIKSLRHLRQLHAHSIKTGASSDPVAMTSLLSFLALSPNGSIPYAHLLLLHILNPDLLVFNLMIRAHSSPRSPTPSASLSLFAESLARGHRPDHFTFPFLLKACARIPSVAAGKAVHGFALKSGLSADPFVESNLLFMYCTFGLIELAVKVFAVMRLRDVVSSTTMIIGYARCGRIDEARRLFDEMPKRDPAAWSAMVTGYVHGGRFAEGLELFDAMRRSKVHLNEAGVVSALTACSHLGALKHGEWIHGYIEESGMGTNSIVGTALVDMYGKCGKIERALNVFDHIVEKSLVSWTVMIKALAAHGMVVEALNCLRNMCFSGIKPDGAVFVGVLSACAHAGLIKEGRECFRSIPSPGLDHYACMVDLLGRAGLLEEAQEIIEEMPMEPDEAIWGALLNSCKIHGNIELGERAGRELMNLGTEDGGHYVLLANLYASCRRWDDVVKVRRMMGRDGIERSPGWSSIEINGVTYRFVAGDRNTPQSELIYTKLHEVVERVRLAGYVEDLRGCLLDVDEDEKKRCLVQHSERLALAFGLINTGPDQTLVIMKNLRVCWDCHCFMKLASLAYGRKIVMRDRNRFHHFNGGSCSCRDYW